MNNKQPAKMQLSTYERIVLIIALICVIVLFVYKAFSMQAQPDKVITYTVDNTSGSAVSTSSQDKLTEKVNINTADKERLSLLSGIGETKAAAIISYREANGGFADIEELLKVDGIGQKTFEKIKDMICVE